MEGADALGLIAEIGIAIAGFAGVIAALRAPDGRIGSHTALRVGVLIGMSATVVLMAVLPFAPHHTGLGVSTMWAVSSSVMAALLLLLFIVPTRIGLRFPAEERPSLGWVAPVVNLTSFGLVIILQIANLVGLRELWPFLCGLVAILALSLFYFAYILFAPFRAEVPA